MKDPKDTLIEMKVRKLMVDTTTHVPILILANDDGSKFLPIWIGLFEANAIATSLEGKGSARPMTHDLAVHLMESLDGYLQRIVINDLEESTFYAQLIIEQGGVEVSLDSRPSDAIAIALRASVPILVAEKVLEQATKEDLSKQLNDDEELKKWLEDVDPEDLGKYTM